MIGLVRGSSLKGVRTMPEDTVRVCQLTDVDDEKLCMPAKSNQRAYV